MEYFIHWLIELPKMFVELEQFLLTPLPYINIAPLGLFTIGGIAAILGFKALHLVIG